MNRWHLTVIIRTRRVLKQTRVVLALWGTVMRTMKIQMLMSLWMLAMMLTMVPTMLRGSPSDVTAAMERYLCMLVSSSPLLIAGVRHSASCSSANLHAVTVGFNANGIGRIRQERHLFQVSGSTE